MRNTKKKYFECKFKEACGNQARPWEIIKSFISSTDPVLPDEVTTSYGLKLNEPDVICIRKIIFVMKSSSAGSDSINLLVLKAAFPSISHIFTSLINACLMLVSCKGSSPIVLKSQG